MINKRDKLKWLEQVLQDILEPKSAYMVTDRGCASLTHSSTPQTPETVHVSDQPRHGLASLLTDEEWEALCQGEL